MDQLISSSSLLRAGLSHCLVYTTFRELVWLNVIRSYMCERSLFYPLSLATKSDLHKLFRESELQEPNPIQS